MSLLMVVIASTTYREWGRVEMTKMELSMLQDQAADWQSQQTGLLHLARTLASLMGLIPQRPQLDSALLHSQDDDSAWHWIASYTRLSEILQQIEELKKFLWQVGEEPRRLSKPA